MPESPDSSSYILALRQARDCYSSLAKRCISFTCKSGCLIQLLTPQAVALHGEAPHLPVPRDSTIHQLAQDRTWTSPERHLFARRLNQSLEAGFDINTHDSNGYTPLMLTVLGKRRKETDEDTGAIVEEMVINGASVHQQDRQNRTVLHMAVESGKMAATEVLLSRGAHCNVRQGNGRSVLTVAHKSLKLSKKEEDLHARIMACTIMLIDHGAVTEPSRQQQWGA